jgi:hypothetical protein
VSARYEIVRFLVRLGIGLLVAVVLAVLWALARGGAFRDSLEAGFYVVGASSVLLAVLGGSPSRRDASSASWRDRWAYADTFAVNRDNPPETTLGPVVMLVAVGVVLIALAVAII